MFFSSIIYYVITRYSQRRNIDRKLYLAVNFLIPTIVYLILGLSRGYRFHYGINVLLISFFVAFFLNFIGSVASYISMRHAPNAGYSVIIQKSYGLYTSIVAVFLFGATLTLIKYFAILIIVGSLFIVSISNKKKSKHPLKADWVFLAFIGFVCYGTSALIGKQVISSGIPSVVYLFWVLLFSTAICMMDIVKDWKDINKKVNKKDICVLLLVGFSVSFFYYFKQVAEIAAPNIGYVNAINAASNVFLTLFLALIFKESLTPGKFVGVVGVVFGIILLIV